MVFIHSPNIDAGLFAQPHALEGQFWFFFHQSVVLIAKPALLL